MNFWKTIAAASVAFVALTSGASAVTIANDGKSVDITCTGSCEFWYLGTDPDAFSASNGSWLSGSYGGIDNNNSNANRLKFVKNVTGLELERTESTDTGAGSPILAAVLGDDASWTSSAAYFLAWGGPDPRYILIKNNTANNMFTWDAGTKAGLSGVDGFGVIPLPAAGWLLLAGLGGLAAYGRKKRWA